jgi:hypothetical protein
MNWKLFGKVLLLVAVSVTTSMVTSKVMAQRKKRKVPSSAVVSGAFFPSNGITSIDSVNVALSPEGLHVKGKATIRDFRPNVAFVWSIRVRDPALRRIVAERRYDTQVFQPRQDTHELSPTFEDTINPRLPAGIYKIELVLYEVPPGGVALLDDPDMGEHQLMAKNTMKVTIGP